MDSVLIIYGSTTGNTAFVAEKLEAILSENGHSVTSKDVSSVSTKDACEGYDAVFFGCSTWGQDSIELQDDFVPFFESFESIKVTGKKVAVFGCGDSSYEYFCGAVDAIEEKLQGLGVNILIKGLKIDGDPSDSEDQISAWAEKIQASL